MYITIENKREYTNDFLNSVVDFMLRYGLEYINKNRAKLLPLDLYLNRLYTSNKKISSFNIIVAGLRNIKYKRTTKEITISLDDAQKMPMSDRITLLEVCQLINYGNTELQPYPIFSVVFGYVYKNIDQLYENYTYGVLF